MLRAKGDIPTTDEMDERDRSSPLDGLFYIFCGHCYQWHQDRQPEPRTSVFPGPDRMKCMHCGSMSFDWQSTISARTFNEKTATARAKRRVKK